MSDVSTPHFEARQYEYLVRFHNNTSSRYRVNNEL